MGNSPGHVPTSMEIYFSGCYLDSRKFSVLGLASIQQFSIGKVQPPAPSKHPEKVRPFTAPRKS